MDTTTNKETLTIDGFTEYANEVLSDKVKQMIKEIKMKKNNFIKQKTLDNSNLPEFSVGGTVYKGSNPQFHFFGVERGWLKVSKGIPFVKVGSNEG